MPSARTRFLLLFALSSARSFALSILQTANPPASALVNHTLSGELHCYTNNPFALARPNVYDCMGAIRRLSLSNVQGTFHHPVTGDDRFKLPVIKAAGHCQVSVDLKGPMPEDGTWLGLGLAATQLTAACADREGFLAKKGGWTDAGDHDRIRITVQAARQILD